jgi:hypothetical protein
MAAGIQAALAKGGAGLMRRIFLAGAAAVALLVTSPARADLPVIDITAIGKLVTELGYLDSQLKNMITNTTGLGGSAFVNFTGSISQLQGIIGQASVLIGYAGTMLGNLGNPSGYAGYALPPFASWQQQLVNDDQAIANAVNSAGLAIQQQGTQLQTASASLASLETQGLSSIGRLQAQQTINDAAVSIGHAIQSEQSALTALQQVLVTAELKKADERSYIRTLTNQQEQAGMQATCAAAASTGFAQPAVCANVGGAAGTLPTTTTPAPAPTATTPPETTASNTAGTP